MYKRYTTIAGRTIITRCTCSTRVKTEQKGRKPRTNPTPEAVARINRINQERDLTAKINHNFGPGDLWVTLTYSEILPVEEAMETIARFKRSLRGLCRRRGIELKMIESTGIGERSGKPHHHIVLSGEVTRDMLLRYWPEHQVHQEVLWSDGNYRRIANYMLRNAQQTKDRRGKNVRAYRCTRSIVTPQTRVETMKRIMDLDPEDLPARKGYSIDRDSIRIYEHAITEAVCCEYIEVSIGEEPRLKRYNKGRPAPRERIYPEEWDEQMIMEVIDQWTEGA